LPRLEAEWTGSCRDGAELWRRLKAVGFAGAPRVVSEWMIRRRCSESTAGAPPRKPPSARVIVRLMTGKRDPLTPAENALLATVEQAVPALRVARELPEHFQTLIRSKAADGLDA